MKLKCLLYIGVFLLLTDASAQVGFNNVNPDPSSVLDLTSTDKGLLIPRLTTTQRLAISSPAVSLMVFDTTLGKFFYVNASGQWIAINPWDQTSPTSLSYNGKVGLNATPDASAVMDITATDKGMLVPRMTTTQRTAIASPANSLLVFDVTLGKFCFYSNSQWNVLESVWSRGSGTNIYYSGQVGVNNATPDASSILDITATDKGMLVPRLTTTQRLAIATPANSLLVFDLTLQKYCYYNSSLAQWLTLDNYWSKGSGTDISYTGRVGVNTTSPNASSIVDMTATDKGILIPRMTTTQRQAIASPATGLLVYDTNDSRFYFYNAGQWYAVNALDRVAGSTTITHTGNLTVNGTVTATSFSGITGTVPTGGIIMWSGTIANIPSGWHLCDGATGLGLTIPDLRERFIVGAGGDNPSVSSSLITANGVGRDGYSGYLTDDKNGVPSISSVPSHTHAYKDRYLYESNTGSMTTAAYRDPTSSSSTITWNGGLGNAGGIDTGNGAFLYYSATSDTNTATTAVESRPPYYALAFIIKL